MHRLKPTMVLLLVSFVSACTFAPAEPIAPLAPANLILLEQCSADDVQSRLGLLNNEFQAANFTSADAALDALLVLQTQIDGIFEECQALKLTEADNPAIELLDNLWRGGFILYVRHTHTDRSRGDTDLTTCDGQRILSEQGRAEALMIRPYFAELQIPVNRLYSTEYCRVRETAVLAFGTPDIILREDLFEMMPQMISTPPNEGQNIIIVAHIGTLESSLGLPDTFEEGDTLVYRPMGEDGYRYVERIALADWAYLVRVAQALRAEQQ